MPPERIRVGTRGSKLALTQTRMVIAALRARWPDTVFDECVITTTGDRVTGLPLSQIGERGLFTKEIEVALLRGDADLGVHSAKDLPTALAEGLHIEIALEREDPRDALVLASSAQGAAEGPPDEAHVLDVLPQGAIVGISSERRKAQLLHHRPDLRIVPLRGNLDTRLRKLETEGLDAIVVAAAGLARIGAAAPGEGPQVRVLPIPVDICLPAAGQGALAVEFRSADDALAQLVAPLRHEDAAAAVTAERAGLAALASGCQVPIALYASVADDVLRLRGVVAEPTGRRLVRAERSGSPGAAAQIGKDVAQELLERGAGELLSSPGARAGQLLD